MNPVGVIKGLLFTILKMAFGDLGNLEAVGAHLFQAKIDFLQADAARTQQQSTDGFCSSHPAQCPGWGS